MIIETLNILINFSHLFLHSPTVKLLLILFFSTNFTIDFDDSDFDDQQVFEVLKHLDRNKSPDIHEFSNHMI